MLNMFSHMLVLHIGHSGIYIYRPSFSVRRFFTEPYLHTAALPFFIQGKFLPWETKNKTLNFLYIFASGLNDTSLWWYLSFCLHVSAKDTYRDSGSVFLECHMRGLVELLLRYLQSTLFILPQMKVSSRN